ncbi:MAG: PadR family transcriptional regulator [Gemmatimonas sp.]
MASQPTSLLQGTLDLLVLELLRAEPTNGFELAKRIQALSKDVLKVNAGSLYPALYRLEAKALIRAEWETTRNNRQAKVYMLTAAGKKHLAGERATWDRFSGAVAAILNREAEA